MANSEIMSTYSICCATYLVPSHPKAKHVSWVTSHTWYYM